MGKEEKEEKEGRMEGKEKRRKEKKRKILLKHPVKIKFVDSSSALLCGQVSWEVPCFN